MILYVSESLLNHLPRCNYCDRVSTYLDNTNADKKTATDIYSLLDTGKL